MQIDQSMLKFHDVEREGWDEVILDGPFLDFVAQLLGDFN